MTGQRPLIFWITLSLALHVAGLALSPLPDSFSPPSPVYLVVDIFSGPAISGTGHGLDNESVEGGKIKDLSPSQLVYPKPKPENLPSPLPPAPVPSTKVTKEDPSSPDQDTIKSPPENPPVPVEKKTTNAPGLAVTAAPLTDHPKDQEKLPEIPAASGISNGQPPNKKTGDGTGTGHGSGSGSGRGGQAGAGSPVETPFAYGTNPPPPYPSTARRRGWEGEVLLLVEVSAKGKVGKITVKSSSGYQILDRAARNAIYRWKFQAAQRNGRAVAGKVMVPIRFSIKDAK